MLVSVRVGDWSNDGPSPEERRVLGILSNAFLPLDTGAPMDEDDAEEDEGEGDDFEFERELKNPDEAGAEIVLEKLLALAER